MVGLGQCVHLLGGRGRFTKAIIRVTLPSDGSHDFYPQNTLSNFPIKLARTLEFNGEYECALSEIIFPNRLVNVREGHNMIDIIDLRKMVKFSEEEF